MQCRLYVTPTDLTQIPNGELAAVKGSPFDFTTPHSIGERIGAVRSHNPQTLHTNLQATFLFAVHHMQTTGKPSRNSEAHALAKNDLTAVL